MKKLLNIVLFAFITKFAIAQVSIQIPIRNPWSIGGQELISCSVFSDSYYEVAFIQSNLFDQTGRLIVSVKSSNFSLKKGVNLTSQSSKVETISYGNSDQVGYYKSTSRLLPGTYSNCIQLVTGGGMELIVEECDNFDSDINIQLDLISPFNGDTIESKLPILNWMTSGDVFARNNLNNYQMVIAEIGEGQSPQQAILENINHYFNSNLNSFGIQYPSSAKILKEGKSYAWQVRYMINGIPYLQTDVWKFTIRPPLIEKEFKYVNLRSGNDNGIYYAANNRIYFTLDELYANEHVEYGLFSDGEQVKLDLNDGQENSSISCVGFNQFEIDLDKYNLEEGEYNLVVKNEKGDRYQLRVLISK